ncbi:hypothetical protein IW150_006048, partial [Coemansia sp. RSA 2607]
KTASTKPSKLYENSVLDALKDLYSMQIESVKRNPASDHISGMSLAEIICQLCDMSGHKAKDCPKMNPHSFHSGGAPASKVDRGQYSKVAIGGMAVHALHQLEGSLGHQLNDPNIWILDSG